MIAKVGFVPMFLLSTPASLGPDPESPRDDPPSPRNSSRNHRIYQLLALGIFAVAAVLRLTALEADPPPTLSRDFISDETWWAHNARNHALFGSWRLDDFNQGFFAAPLHTALERLSFAAGGVHLGQLRLVSALAGLATVALVGLIMKREVGPRGSLVAMALIATDYFSVSYDRTGFVEPLPSAFMALSFAFATWPGRGRGWLALSGFAAVLAVLSKLNALFFLGAPLAWTLLRRPEPGERSSRAGDALAMILGMVVPLAIFGAAFVAPNLAEYVSQNGRLRDEAKVRGMMALLNIFSVTILEENDRLKSTGFLTQALLPTTLAALWFVHALGQAARHGFRAWLRGLSNAERIALLWIAAFVPYFVLQNNGVDRRYYVFAVPLAMLGAHLFAFRRDERIELHTTDLRINRALIVISACLFVAGVYLRVHLADGLIELFRRVPLGKQSGISKISASFLASVLLVIAGSPIFYLLLRRLPRKGPAALSAALLLVLVCGSVQLARFVKSATSLTFTLDRASHRFAAALQPGDRIMDGQPLILETACRNLIMLDRSGGGYPYYGMAYLDEFRPTHKLMVGSGPVAPEEFDREILSQSRGRLRSDPRSYEIFETCPDDQGKMRAVFTLARLVPVAPDDASRGPLATSGPAAPGATASRPSLSPADGIR